MMSTYGIPVSAELINEIAIRSQGRVDATTLIESLITDFLDRTKGDRDIWSATHVASAEAEVDEFEATFGNPRDGYQWNTVFLPNGSELRSTYKGEAHFAEVRHGRIYYKDRVVSPSQFASEAAGNTSRNAWRDLWVKRPTERWTPANSMRK